MHDDDLRAAAAAVLEANRRGASTVPATGLYPYQWCWDTGPISLGWAAAGDWDQAWSELRTLLSAQWSTGFVPHIVFWTVSDDYFPGPDAWGTVGHGPPGGPATTGVTQPPLPVSAAAALFHADPERTRAARELRACWRQLVAWLAWLGRARRGPHGAVVAVHPWETGMDNSPAWDAPLLATPESSHAHLERRDVRTVSADERPTTVEYRHYLGIVASLRAAGWDTERQLDASPFAVEDPGFTAIAARAAADLAAVAPIVDSGGDASELARLSSSWRDAIEALWDDEHQWYRAFDVRAARPVGPATAGGLVGLWSGCAPDRARVLTERIETWSRGSVHVRVPSTDPAAQEFDPIRYWRGPVWVLVNWMVADGLRHSGRSDLAEQLRVGTHELVASQGFCEYFDPRDGRGIGGTGFSWTAALTLWWLTGSHPASMSALSP